MTSIFYNFVWSNLVFEPTSLLRHQKYLVLKQVVDSHNTIKLRNIEEERKKEREREASFITLIKSRRAAKRREIVPAKCKNPRDFNKI